MKRNLYMNRIRPILGSVLFLLGAGAYFLYWYLSMGHVPDVVKEDIFYILAEVAVIAWIGFSCLLFAFQIMQKRSKILSAAPLFWLTVMTILAGMVTVLQPAAQPIQNSAALALQVSFIAWLVNSVWDLIYLLASDFLGNRE